MTKEEKEKLYFYQVMEEFYKEFDYDKELARTRSDEVSTARAEGRAEGKAQSITYIVSNMIKMGLPKEEILELTGINAEEYDKLITT